MNRLSSSSLCTLAVLVVTFYLRKVFKAWKGNPSRLPYPPGPPLLPLIGCQFPTVQPWLTYTEWGRQYGPLVHAQAFGQHVVIINSLQVATEFFEKRSHIYSDRPAIPMINLTGWGFSLAFMPYGERWRRHRRMFQQNFRRVSSQNYRPIQLRKIHDMLHGLLTSPQNFRDHFGTLGAAIIMSTVYGYDMKPSNDPYVKLAEEAFDKLLETVFPGAFAVNTFPILRHLPGWLPGCGFQHLAADSRQLVDRMKQAPYDFAKQNVQDGRDSKSIVAKLLETSQGHNHVDETTMQDVAAVAYAAGFDTTISALASFFLAMALFPEAQAKAQSEIDAVVGPGELPGFEDRSKLVYVEALYREVLRWKPMLPLSLARRTSDSDVYDGYFIPKGAMVFENIWAMSYDESIYAKPEEFMPERFLTENRKLTDDPILVFGLGRRICPGRHMADESVWATIVSVLSTFTITKARDAEGNEIDIIPAYSDGFVSHPGPFECAITPRSEAARNLIESTSLKDGEAI